MRGLISGLSGVSPRHGLMPIVGFDNVLDQPMTHNILFVEIDKGDAVDVPQNFFDFD